VRLAIAIGLAAGLLFTPVAVFAADCVPAPTDLTSSGQLRIATHLTTPPQGFLDNDKPAGFAIELGNAIAEQMCLKAEFVNIAFAGMFPGLNAKKFDTILAGVGITPERQQSFDFVPYFQGGLG
jgi:polar amino acid transport system substrate-binding protein